MQFIVTGYEKYTSKYNHVAKYQTSHNITMSDLEDAEYTARTVEADAIIVVLGKGLDLVKKRQLRELKGSLVMVVTHESPLSQEDHFWVINTLSAVVFHDAPALHVFMQIESVLRLHEKWDPAEMTIGDLTYNRGRKSIRTPVDEILLPRRESNVLEILMRSKGLRLSKEQLAARIYGLEDYPATCIESHVSKLRTKIRRISKVVDIEQRRFMGYALSQRSENDIQMQEEEADEPVILRKENILPEYAVLSFSV